MPELQGLSVPELGDGLDSDPFGEPGAGEGGEHA
jgi:hypothetical protein